MCFHPTNIVMPHQLKFVALELLKRKKNDGYTLCVQQMENLSSCRWSSVAQKNSTLDRWAMLKLKLRSSI